MASRSLNRVTLIGNLTRDPELKYTPNGTAVCTFGVATNRSWSTTSGEIKEDVQFHRIVCWQKLAELVSKLLTKGRKVYLEGRIVYRTYVGKDNVQRTTAEIVMDDFILFDDRNRQFSDTSSDYQSQTKTSQKTDSDNNIDISQDLDQLDKIEKEDEKNEEITESSTKSKKKIDAKATKNADKDESKEEIEKDMNQEEVDDDDIPF